MFGLGKLVGAAMNTVITLPVAIVTDTVDIMTVSQKAVGENTTKTLDEILSDVEKAVEEFKKETSKMLEDYKNNIEPSVIDTMKKAEQFLQKSTKTKNMLNEEAQREYTEYDMVYAGKSPNIYQPTI